MSKVFACLCALLLIVSVGATADEVVSFTAVDSQGASGLFIYSAAVTGGFDLGDIDWDGFASTIASGTYGSELTLNISGPLGSATITLGSGSSYDPGAQFTGTSADFTGLGDPAGIWLFDFYEAYDDYPTGAPDATWDTIDFTFVALVGDTCFTAVDSQATSGLMSYTATVAGGFTLASIDWDGFASTIASGTYGSELTLDISGPLGSSTITLGSGTSYSPGAQFIGSDSSLAGGDPAGVWTFDFYETYDDGSDGMPDATWDDICFEFTAPDPCTGPNDCASTELIGAGSFAGDTTDCSDTFPSYNLWSWALLGNDHVYSIEVACPGTEICVTFTPGSGQDGAIALSTECVDGPVTAVAGADDTLAGDVEAFCYITTTTDVGTMYIYVDSYGDGSEGAYTLDVTITGPVANDTCDNAVDVSAGGIFAGTTVCAVNDYDGYCGISWAADAPDAAYVMTIADGDTVDITMTPLDGQDAILYVVGDCGDIIGSCVDGADNGFSGDPEFLSITFDCGGTYYIIADGWSTAEGAFDLDVVITPAVPVDTFDVAMLCTTDTLILPAQTKIKVRVTNTFTAMRQICGNVGVTLCNGNHIANVRVGNLVLAAGEFQTFGWGQVIPAYPSTCDCTLVFDTDAIDCTPCEDTNGVPAGWTETATCGITTACPE